MWSKTFVGKWVACLLICCVGLAACDGRRRPDAPPSGVVVAQVTAVQDHDKDGEVTAAYLQWLYDYRPSACVTGPAFRCSGILLRAFAPVPGGHVWAPNPTSPKPDGISLSWLRRDATFRWLSNNMASGLMLRAPEDNGDYVYYPLQLLCAYPVDADSNRRPPSGCGANTYYPLTSGPCQAQGITSQVAWLAHYRKAPNFPHSYQCGFNVRDGVVDRIAIFALLPGLMAAPELAAAGTQNEVIIGGWPRDPNPRQLPIVGFFYWYVGGKPQCPADRPDVAYKGLCEAQSYQRDYVSTTGGADWKPILRLFLPERVGEAASITYDPADQAIP